MILRAMLAVAYATGKASHTRQVKGDGPDKKGYPCPPGWGFGVGLTSPNSKNLLLRKSSKEINWIDLMIFILSPCVLLSHVFKKTNSCTIS
jgi:hypothetical protein